MWLMLLLKCFAENKIVLWARREQYNEKRVFINSQYLMTVD